MTLRNGVAYARAEAVRATDAKLDGPSGSRAVSLTLGPGDFVRLFRCCNFRSGFGNFRCLDCLEFHFFNHWRFHCGGRFSANATAPTTSIAKANWRIG